MELDYRSKPAAVTAIPATMSTHDRFERVKSHAMLLACIVAATLIVALLGLITGYLFHIGFSSVSISFFTKVPAPYGADGFPGGMLNALEGTAILILLASAIGIPLGILAGVYLAEYDAGSWLAAPVRFVSDVLAGVPSIVVGILGYELLVVPIGRNNAWAGALALAFIMIPIVTRTTEEMLRLVPGSYREASIALGDTKAGTILKVVLPSATGSVVTGIMLAIARIAGETAPLLFTALGSRLLVHRIQDLNQPFPSLTVQIFNYSISPYPQQQSLAWAGILVLVVLIFVLNIGIRFATRRRK
jgi:phosphate transport system permease protein